jgi:hypothetical protein
VNGPNTTALGPNPGEADLPKVPTDGDLNSNQAPASDGGGNNNDGFPIWAAVVVAIVCMFVFSFLVVGAVRYRRQGHFSSMPGGDEEDVWVRTGKHDSKFTRRALNTDEGDGVWKRENINDLKFKTTT